MASEPVRLPDPIRFGGDYELDLRAFEVRRSGQALKLERIPMEVLVLLVERRGQLVTRDEIVERVWGKGVFLDTDNSINAAIRKIRQLLKDDSDRPRFVMTITGKGYRFVAPIEEAATSGQAVPPLPIPVPGESLFGKKVSHYRVLQLLGSGGMGVVYKAEDLKLGRPVALKFLHEELARDAAAFERLQREARAASALDHPNICSIYQLGEHEGQPFIVMQFLEGQTLRDWIGAASPQSTASRVEKLVEFAIQIADGLQAAHEKSIVHRDIKPANIFITSREQAKILDFGVAKFQDAELQNGGLPEAKPAEGPAGMHMRTDSLLTLTGASVGTPSYLSPEQIRGEKLDARTDLFSFGLVLYEMATGQRAFSGNTATVIRDAVLNLGVVPVRQVCPDIPQRLEKIINKSLEKDRDLRYQSVKELQVDLRALAPPTLAGVRRMLIWAPASIVVLFLALMALNPAGIRQRIWPRRESEGPPAPARIRPSVAVLGFRNLNGKEDEAWISTALSEMLVADLSAGQQLHVIPSEDVARMKLDLQLPAADNYGRDTLRQIRNQLGSDIVVLGSYLATGEKTGGKIRVDLQVQDARQGETIGVVQSDGTEAELAELASRGGAGLRQKLGVAGVTADNARQVSASVPANPEAARLYAEGLAKLHDYDALAARHLLERAVSLDAKHALSHSALAEAWSALGYDAKAESEAKVALDLSGDLSREQRLSIEGRSHEYARDVPGAIEIYKTLRNFFPDDLDYALRLASAQTKVHQGKDALQTISRARQLRKPDSEDARIDLAEANAAESLGDFNAAQRAAAVAAGKAQEQGRRLLLAQAKELEAWTWERLGDLDKAGSEMREARDLAEAAQNQRLLGLSLKQLGVIAEDKGEFEKARIFHKNALAIFQKIGQQRQVARTLESLGNIDYEQERLAEAKRYYEDALRIDREISASSGDTGSDLGSIANVLDSLGDLVGATQMQEQSLKGFREASDKRGESDVLLNLGSVLVERGELASAKQNYDQALSIARAIGYKHGESSILSGLAEIDLAEDRLQDARVEAQQALTIRQEDQEQASVARSQVQLARIALAEGKAAESEQLARQATPVFEEQKMAGDASVCDAVLARALLAQSKIDQANAAADKALSFAHQTVDRSSNFAAALAAAEVDIAGGRGTGASKALESVVTEAGRRGYLEFEYEARLDLGKNEVQSGNPAAGRRRLQQLQDDARSKNFLLIARKTKVEHAKLQ